MWTIGSTYDGKSMWNVSSTYVIRHNELATPTALQHIWTASAFEICCSEMSNWCTTIVTYKAKLRTYNLHYEYYVSMIRSRRRSARSVAVSYKLPMLVTRVRFPACASYVHAHTARCLIHFHRLISNVYNDEFRNWFNPMCSQCETLHVCAHTTQARNVWFQSLISHSTGRQQGYDCILVHANGAECVCVWFVWKGLAGKWQALDGMINQNVDQNDTKSDKW